MKNANLLNIRDTISGLHFLVDTGAEVSVLPVSSRLCNSNYRTKPLHGPDGKPIATFGTKLLSFSLEKKQYSWNFIVAAVSRSLIGADFLIKHGILVDLKRKRLLGSCTDVTTPVSSPRTSVMNVGWLRQ